MLSSIPFPRKSSPQAAKRWEFIYEAIKNSKAMDSNAGRPSTVDNVAHGDRRVGCGAPCI
jgi:hypothetical protein